MSDLAWISPLSPQAPPVPKTRHWLTGMAVAGALSLLVGWWYASIDHSVAGLDGEEEERVVVALGGGAAKKLEAPPPADAPVTDSPPVAAERSKDAPPVAAPPEPRPVASWVQGEGSFSSGTGAGASPSPPPPVPPPPPPSPKPAPPPQVSTRFVELSTLKYASLLEYPSASLREGEQGVGVLSVQLRQDGSVVGWELVKSTGSRRLDQEIERVARKVKGLDPLPAGFAGKLAIVHVPITFALREE